MAKKKDKVIDFVNSVFEAERQFLGLLLDFVPEEAKTHLKAARREKLLALRSILDAKIKDLEEEVKKAGKKRPQRVKVE